MIVGQELTKLLDEMYSASPRPIQIVETGCLRSTKPEAEEGDGWSTKYITEWLKRTYNGKPHPKLISIDMNFESVKTAESFVDSSEVIFVPLESVAALERFALIDFAFLDTSDDLNHGLSEFRVAESKGAQVIVMDDFETKAARAFRYAEQNGWHAKRNGRLAIMKR